MLLAEKTNEEEEVKFNYLFPPYVHFWATS